MKPKNGLVTEAKIIRVRDADTYIVEVTRQFPVRVTDVDKLPLYFNTPEKNTKEGKEALKFAKELLVGKTVTLFIPSDNPLQLTDIASFDRIVAEVWLDETNVAQIFVDQGMAEYKSYK